MNKKINSYNRLLNIGSLTSNFNCTLSMIENLENLYGKFCFVPLDIPIIFDEKIIDWFIDLQKPIFKQKKDITGDNKGLYKFDSVNVYFDKHVVPNSKNTVWSSNNCFNFNELFPYFYQQLMDLLPLKKISRLFFWRSVNTILPHRDQSLFLDCPNSIRIMIYDNNPRSTLYIHEDADIYTGEKFYIPRIKNTNSFIWNNLRVMHGSDYNKNYYKILLILPDFNVDYDKYVKILDKSITKYHNNLLISNNTKTNFI